MTAVTRIMLASPSRGTMLWLAAYMRDIEGFMAPAEWMRATLPGKS
jgi:hypothetical protein